MAATWRSVALAVAFASAKSMIDISSETDNSRIHRARRFFQFNNGTAAVTGVLTAMRINRSTVTATPPAGGSLVTPVPHDTASGALNANFTSGTGRTISRTSNFRQYLWSNDEPSVSLATMDEWELFVPFATVFEAGYGDTNVEPIVCRPGYGVEIQQSGSSAVGSNDFEIEFTDEAT